MVSPRTTSGATTIAPSGHNGDSAGTPRQPRTAEPPRSPRQPSHRIGSLRETRPVHGPFNEEGTNALASVVSGDCQPVEAESPAVPASEQRANEAPLRHGDQTRARRVDDHPPEGVGVVADAASVSFASPEVEHCVAVVRGRLSDLNDVHAPQSPSHRGPSVASARLLPIAGRGPESVPMPTIRTKMAR